MFEIASTANVRAPVFFFRSNAVINKNSMSSSYDVSSKLNVSSTSSQSKIRVISQSKETAAARFTLGGRLPSGAPESNSNITMHTTIILFYHRDMRD